MSFGFGYAPMQPARPPPAAFVATHPMTEFAALSPPLQKVLIRECAGCILH